MDGSNKKKNQLLIFNELGKALRGILLPSQLSINILLL